MVDTFSSSWRPQLHQRPRWLMSFLTAHRTQLLVLWVVGFVMVFGLQVNSIDGVGLFRMKAAARPIPRLRPVAFNLTDFGGVGDGKTLNTAAFERAVEAISKAGARGGGQLNVPAGRWLTAPFNLTNHMTLFLAEGAVILGIEDENHWPLMPPLPSYGYGREHKGPRYGSLIHGQNLRDIVITGYNGTIDGQGQAWWTKYKKKILTNTRGPLVQLMWSKDIVISNITLRNSPFWTLHPYDCKNVTISGITILAPVFGAPNTDGIDPDSCQDVLIENSYICVGDDAIAIKSGWDQYGIAYGRPSTNIIIRNLIVRSVVSAGISIGSEMSGGVSNVTVENLFVWETRRGVRIKTAPGRGGYVRNIAYRNVIFENVRVGIVIKTDYNEHPDEGFDPKALPIITNISFSSIHGQGVRVPVRIHGSEDIPIKDVSFRDMSVGLTYKKKHIFQCSFVDGHVIGSIFPSPCQNLDLYDEQGNLVKRSVSQNITDIDYDI
ncbi:probable polygalacturonase [Zingiber officinale]|uniref:probable polygalacturonase n=1 Tax=Zingiber officinale TaxID=94328 RepID=UPI001C4D0C89|nr:probable polygalacturonase [Zingiber officinale]